MNAAVASVMPILEQCGGRRVRLVPVLGLALVLGGGSPAAGQVPPGPGNVPSREAVLPDTYLDAVAATLHGSARENWDSIDESVLRYTAVIRQRIAAAIRTPLKDRTLYRNETAVRAFWDRDHDALVQVLGARARYPGREGERERGEVDWLDDLAFDQPFEPGGDRLLFGLVADEDDAARPGDDDFWLAHPLAPGADSLYRFRSGDTLTLRLPDGRALQTVKLDVLPREADVHRITGSLWIEPESGALVRAVYRLSRQFDAIRDIPELAEEEARGEFRYVPGLLKPWTFDMTMVAIDYGFWNFQVWLPRAMRVEGEAAAGIMKFPVSMDVSYRVESVTTVADLAAAAEEEPTPEEELRTRRFASREEAMAFMAELMTDQDGVTYEPLADSSRGSGERASRLLVPADRSRLEDSPHLPPPIWDDAPGFATEQELGEYMETLADLPAPPVPGGSWGAAWGWDRPGLLRYNRVEGPAPGGRLQGTVGAGFLGPLEVEATGFLGLADLEPKARLDLRHSGVKRRLTLGFYRELQATDPRGRHLDFGNSLNAFLFGRDDGEYFLATGVDFTWRPPTAVRESFLVRAYAERHHSVGGKTDFALFRAFDGDWRFRTNLDALGVEEAGGEVRVSPWWGRDVGGVQGGMELYGQGGAWRFTGSDVREDYARASATLRLALPLATGRWRVGMEAAAGTTWGSAPVQRGWFLGGAATLRGYPASTLYGSSFTRGRLEVARVYSVGAVSLFGDAGWAGVRQDFSTDDLLYGVGVGGSLMDGLVRLDLSRGLTGAARQFRLDLYLDAIL